MTRKPLLWLGTSVPALLAAAAATAQTADRSDAEIVQLETIYISSYRSNSEASAIPGAVQVIDRAMLERAATTGQSLERVLSDFIPGLSPSNGTVAGASQNMRGRKVQVLIDGVAHTSELRGFSRELGLLDLNAIERIEVIRGSNAQLGNGATGGLINIITRDAGEGSETTLTTRLSAQTEDVKDSLGYELALSHGTRVNDLGLRFELSTKGIGNRYDGNGNQLSSDPLVGQGGGDNNESYRLGFAADYAWGNNTLDLRLDASKFQQNIDFYTNYLTDPVSVNTAAPYTGQPVLDETQALTLTWTNDGLSIGDVEVQAYATNNLRRAALVEAGVANSLYYPTSVATPTVQDLDSQSVLKTKTFGLNSTVRSDLSAWADGAQLTWGFDLGHDDVEQTMLDGRDLIAPMTQNSYAAFAQLDLPVGDRFELSAGVRYERFDLTVEDFTRPDAAQLISISPVAAVPLPAVAVTGGDFTYDATVFNLGGVWNATEDLQIFAGYSQGFSLPDVGSFTRRAMGANPFAPGGTVSFASIAPKAQIVNTLELGTRYSGAAVDLSASAFLSTSDDGTIFDSATNTLTQQKEEIWGAEVTVEYAASADLNIGLIAAYTEGKFDSDDNGSIDAWLPNNRISSPFTATLYGDYMLASGINLAGEIVYTGAREHAGLSTVEDTTRVNLRASMPLGAGELGLGVDNLFDTYQLNPTGSAVRTYPAGTPLAGQNIPVADEGRRIWVAYSRSF